MDIGDEIIRDIEAYTVEVQSDIRHAVESRTTEMLSYIRNNSPVRRIGGKRQGKYAPGSYKKGWRVVKLSDKNGKYLMAVVQSKNQKGLSHIIDRGHNVVGRNGRVYGRVQGNYAVTQAQGRYRDKLYEDIANILNK